MAIFQFFCQNNYQISKLLLKSANVLKNYLRPCNKATVQMFTLYLDPRSFF